MNGNSSEVDHHMLYRKVTETYYVTLRICNLWVAKIKVDPIDPFHKWLPIKNSFMCI
jgi:hypothetical protein